MLQLLAGMKGTLIVYGLIAGFGGYKWIQSASLQKQLNHATFEVSIHKAANASLAEALNVLEKDKDKALKLVDEFNIAAKKLDKRNQDMAKRITELRGAHEKVDAYLNTSVPEPLAAFLREKYGGEGRKTNKVKAPGASLRKAQAPRTRTARRSTSKFGYRAFASSAKTGVGPVRAENRFVN